MNAVEDDVAVKGVEVHQEKEVEEVLHMNYDSMGKKKKGGGGA